MDKEKSDKKPDEPVDEELERLLKEVKDPLPAGDTPNLPVPIQELVPEPIEDEGSEETTDNDVRLVLNKFHGVTDKILHNYDCDRDEVGDAVERLRDMLMSSKKPPGYVVEVYVSALKTKSDTNTNIIKLLDAFAKIISSTKGTNVSQSTSIDLSALLGEEEDKIKEDE